MYVEPGAGYKKFDHPLKKKHYYLVSRYVHKIIPYKIDKIDKIEKINGKKN